MTLISAVSVRGLAPSRLVMATGALSEPVRPLMVASPRTLPGLTGSVPGRELIFLTALTVRLGWNHRSCLAL